MKKFSVTVAIALSAFALFSTGYVVSYVGRRSSGDVGCPSAAAHAVIVTDTVVVRDTIIISQPALRSERLTGRILTLPLDTSRSASRGFPGVVGVTPDSVTLAVGERVYVDSSFRAVVSGVGAQLDSISVYPRREIVTQRVAVSPPRWSVGVTAGLSYSPARGFAPGIAVGLSYRLWPR